MERKRCSGLCVTVVMAVFLLVFSFQVQAAAEPISLKFANAHPASHVAQEPLKQWAKNIEARTGGKVKVKVFWGTLGKVFELYDMVKDGVVDIAAIGTGWSGGRMPLCEIVDLPFESPDVVTGTKILNALYTQGMLKELDYFKILEIHAMITGNLFLRDKKVTTLEQLKGMKIRPIPGVSTKLVESWKAVPVAVRTPDLYMALQKGQIDGFFTGPDNFVGQKLYEVCKYQVKIPTFNGAFVTIMNKNSWNKIPADLQAIIEQVSAETTVFRVKFYQQLAGEAQKTLDAKLEAYSLSPEEEARWKKAAAGVTEDWISAMEAKGLPGRKAVEVMRKVVAEAMSE